MKENLRCCKLRGKALHRSEKFGRWYFKDLEKNSYNTIKNCLLNKEQTVFYRIIVVGQLKH